MTTTAAPCTARYHHTRAAYAKHGCRCPAACYAASQYRTALATGRLTPGKVPAAATVRRVRGLYERGHDAPTIAAAAGCTAVTVRVLAGAAGSRRPERAGEPEQPTVLRSTAEAIERATVALSRLPGRQLRARARALRAGWAPLRAWDGEVFAIDDPDADDVLAARTVDLAPSLRRAIRDESAAAEARAAELAAERAAVLSRAREHRWTENASHGPSLTATTPAGTDADPAAPRHRKDVA